MSSLQKIIKVTQAQYDTLAAGGTVGEYTGLRDDYLYLIPDEAGQMISLTWTQLVALRDASKLIPGTQYRITDFITTTTQAESRSAGHQFDIIVEAISSSELSEKAQACLHDGDTYFANSHLTAWQVFYSLDNNTNRFAWADSSNGKGVIYRLIDEFFNDVPYDFKNIQFKRYKVTQDTSVLSDFDGLYYGCKDLSGSLVSPQGYTVDDDTDFIWLYTFGGLNSDSESIDMSIQGNLIPNDEGHINGCHHNVFGSTDASFIYPEDLESEWQQFLANNIFFVYDYNDDEYFYGCYSNTIGNYFYFNTIGSNFYSNTIGNYFYSNTIGNDFNYNTIGNDFNYNTIGSNFYSNTIGNYFYSNTICNDFNYNTIGNYFYSNTIGTSASENVYVRYCRFDDGVRYISLTSDDTSASPSNYLQNVHIHIGIHGTSSSNRKTISVPDRNLDYSIDYYANNSQSIILD